MESSNPTPDVNEENAILKGFAERRNSPTPSGGVASIIYYQDQNGEPTLKENAVRAEIHELDASGDIIQRNYMELQARVENPPELTDEDDEILDRIWDKVGKERGLS